MTPAWRWLALVGLGLWLVGLALRSATLLALALPYLALALEPLWRSRPTPALRAQRRASPEVVRQGQPFRLKLTLHNAGPDLEEVEVVDPVPPAVSREETPAFHGPLPAGQERTLRFAATARRGEHRFDQVLVRVEDLLGLQRRRLALPCPASVLVVPQPEALEEVKVAPRRTRVYPGAVRAHRPGAGVEFYGTRAYVSGDPLRHLNWRASARWDLWITNQFEQERAVDVGLILDARRALEVRTPRGSLFEHGVRATASLAEFFLSQGHRVGLLLYGQALAWTFPGYGRRQRGRLLRALARAQPGDHAVFAELSHLPTRLFPARSQLVLISPLLLEDVPVLRALRAREYRVLVVSPDPIAFERPTLPADQLGALAERCARLERNLTLVALRRAGVQVVDWDASFPLEPALRRATGGPE